MQSQCTSYLTCSPCACCCAVCTFADGHLDTFCCPVAPCAPCRTCSNQLNTSYAIVTGGNRSIGFQTARSLVQRGHRVILLCRNRDLGIAAAKSIEKSTLCRPGSVLVRMADLGDVLSIKGFCDEFEENKITMKDEGKLGYGGYDNDGKSELVGASVHILVNNAGLIGKDSVIINHFGHFALTLGLLKPLLRGVNTYGGSSVVHVASTAHSMVAPGLEKRFSTALMDDGHRCDDWGEYCDSKAANIIFSKTLSRILDRHKVRCVSYHPGVLLTDLWRPSSNQPLVSSGGQATTEGQAQGAQLEVPRLLFTCCVKHPKVSGAGLSSLSDPRLLTCFHQSSSSFIKGLTVGHGGGYYQQACCCFVVPVRPLFSFQLSAPSPLLLATYANDTQDYAKQGLESSLWVASMKRLLTVSPEMFASVQSSLKLLSTSSDPITLGNSATSTSLSDSDNATIPQQSLLMNPACPCTELLAVAPLCVCTTCLC